MVYVFRVIPKTALHKKLPWHIVSFGKCGYFLLKKKSPISPRLVQLVQRRSICKWNLFYTPKGEEAEEWGGGHLTANRLPPPSFEEHNASPSPNVERKRKEGKKRFLSQESFPLLLPSATMSLPRSSERRGESQERRSLLLPHSFLVDGERKFFLSFFFAKDRGKEGRGRG